MATPDGRAKSIEASRARLARMIGCDMDDASDTAWSMLAQWFAEGQIRAIMDGAMLVLSYGRLPVSAPIVGAGIGHTVVREVARRLGREHVAFDTVINVAPYARDRASHCAPAAALACLASQS
jgi:(4-(4-[2-(gamma-L-glutamylamino)ethyl]phenoxymethyl)furan-2-yl)methanamine synthase